MGLFEFRRIVIGLDGADLILVACLNESVRSKPSFRTITLIAVGF